MSLKLWIMWDVLPDFMTWIQWIPAEASESVSDWGMLVLWWKAWWSYDDRYDNPCSVIEYDDTYDHILNMMTHMITYDDQFRMQQSGTPSIPMSRKRVCDLCEFSCDPSREAKFHTSTVWSRWLVLGAIEFAANQSGRYHSTLAGCAQPQSRAEGLLWWKIASSLNLQN